MKKNAKKLLRAFEERPNELTWSSDGIIYIDQVSVPRSNIFTLFPMLFKKTRNSNLIGEEDFVQKIKEMNLTYLIEKDSKVSNQAGKGIKTKDAKNSTLSSGDWWYIGP